MGDQIVNIQAVSKEYVIDRARRDFAHGITECPFNPPTSPAGKDWQAEIARLQAAERQEAA
jgi:hypothetical protein